MLCTAGHNNLDVAKFCGTCGINTFQAQTYSLVGSSTFVGSYYSPPPQSTNGLAIASLVLGIVGFLVYFGFGVTPILALVFGYVGRKQIRQRGQNGSGLAIAGIVLGWIGITLIVVFFVVFAVASVNARSCGGAFGSNNC